MKKRPTISSEKNSMNRLVVISGCSGAGKSTLLAELARRGYAVVEEPGRRIVREEMARGGSALPWLDPLAFLRRALTMALADWTSASGTPACVFFDRGVIDAAAGLQHLSGEPILDQLAPRHRYHPRVFLAPPWLEIYQQDPERRHGLESALAEYSRLLEVYPSLGYEVVLLPKTAVAQRADFVLKVLGA